MDSKGSKTEMNTVGNSRNNLDRDQFAYKMSFGSVEDLPLEKLRKVGDNLKESSKRDKPAEEKPPQLEKLRINLEKASQDIDLDEVIFFDLFRRGIDFQQDYGEYDDEE